jgi:hypothetical protein
MSDTGVLVSLDDETVKNRRFLDYTSRDFAAIRQQLVGLAEGLLPDWDTVGEPSDFGTVLLELFAYMGDILNYYIDRTASEAFLGTALRRQSVLYIADMLGYTPVGQSAASVLLDVTPYTPDPTDPLEPFTVPRLVVYSGADSASRITFETSESFNIKPGDPTRQVLAIEGTSVNDQKVGTSFGVPNAEFILPDKGVIYGSVRMVTSEGYTSITWTYTSDLSTSRPTQSVFTTYLDDQNFTHVVFGDNTSGRIPAVGADIFASYRFGVGAAANSLGAHDLEAFVGPSGFDAWKIKVTNPLSPRGGADPESVESMRYNIPRSGARIRSRAVTLNDYADLALQVPGVVKSMAYGTVYTAVKVRIGPALPASGGDVPDESMRRLCTLVEQYMAPRILIGSAVVCEPQSSTELWLNIFIRVTVHVADTYNRSSVRTQVDTVLRAVLAYDIMDFGTRISLGQIYRAVLTVAGVSWAEIRWLSTTSPTIDAAPATPDTLATPEGQPLTPTETLFSASWKFEATGSAEPDPYHYRVDDDTPPEEEFLELFISNHDTTPAAAGSNNRTTDLAKLTIGDHIVVRTLGDNASWWDYIVHEVPVSTPGTGAPATPGFLSAKVMLGRQSVNPVTPSADQDAFMDFVRYSPTPMSVGDVGDIVPLETQIPRIDMEEVEEDPTNWPDYTEAELKHDGLWVQATGGIANS